VPPLPKGEFVRESSSFIFRQVLNGLPVINRRVLDASLDTAGKCTRCTYVKPLQVSPTKPLTYLSKSEILEKSKQFAESTLPKKTPSETYSAQTTFQSLGWFADDSGGVRLAYKIMVMRSRETNFGTKGGGSSYFFDAVSGAILSRFP
jgi:hypothetical protein